MSEQPEDWNREYTVTVTGKTLEAMVFLARWVLDTANVGPMGEVHTLRDGSGRTQTLLPFSVIAACDHVFSWPAEVRAGGHSAKLAALRAAASAAAVIVRRATSRDPLDSDMAALEAALREAGVL